MTNGQSHASPSPPRVAVIGAGMSGILAGIRLRDAGIEDFVIYEKARDLGGTWRDNTYPGLACDVPSHVYSYSFAPNPDWSRRFSPGPEIQDYLTRTAEDQGVRERILFDHECTRCEYRDGRWHLEFGNRSRDIVDFVITATGVLHHPQMPEIEGIDDFEGAVFHSARWDHSVQIEGRRVGVVGTGSTAIQIVRAITEQTETMTLFQRTAQWIMPGQNPAYTDEEKRHYREDPDAIEALRAELDVLFTQQFSDALIGSESPGMKRIEEMTRQHLEDKVHDPILRERLRPDYRAACKRLIVADGFYEAMQLPNAGLATEEIERIEAAGVRTRDGVLHELDVLVFATGFQAHAFMRPMQIAGRGGKTLEEAWDPTPRAYRSVSMPDFPNFFMVVGPHSPIGNFSLVEISELQVDYIMALIARAREGAGEICARQEATDRFNQSILEAMKGTIWVTGCQSWYLDANGVPATWPWTVQTFRDQMAEPDWADFEVVPLA
jgi:cation diffusion facilitator CzcD-associated flavoprotein CzcO